MFSSTQAQSLAFVCPLQQPGCLVLARLWGVPPITDPTQSCRQSSSALRGRLIECIPQRMDLTTLPYRFLNGAAQSSVIVADDELHAVERSLPQAGQQFFQLGTLSRLASSTAKMIRRPFPVGSDCD
jgi:hypothetical protein